MRRPFAKFFTFLSFVVLLLAAAAWVASYRAALWYPLYLDGSGTQAHVWSGRLFVFDCRVAQAPGRGVIVRFDTPSVGQRAVPRTGPSFAAWDQLMRRTQAAGEGPTISSHRLGLPPTTWRDGFGFTHIRSPGGPGGAVNVSYDFYAVPLWAVCLLSAIAPAIWLVRRARRRSRLRAGRCAHCGYDLRGSPAECPECGAEAKALNRRLGRQ